MTTSSSATDYADPRHVEGLDECYFYHAIDLPGLGEVKGDWDLRGCAGEYLGNYDFEGKRAIDVGTASGFLTFEMEKRGAEVVSFDMASGRQWDSVPYPEYVDSWEKILDGHERSANRLKNSYWLSHRLLESKAKAYYGNIYENLPDTVGEFDVAVFGMIFTHLRDPFGALCSILPKVRKSVILTNLFKNGDDFVADFTPTNENKDLHSFWIPTKNCVIRMFEILGFELERTVPCRALCTVGDRPEWDCTAIVATRRQSTGTASK